MLVKLRCRLTYANVMATVAVFIALGGTSYAALRITSKNVPRDALTGADIKNLTGKDVRNNTLTGADVKGLTSADVTNGRLLAEDFARGQLPRGEKGETGATGAAGSALAFARVNLDGSLDASRSKNVAGSNVTRPTPGNGIYCFDGLGFTPANVVATAEVSDRTLNVFGLATDAAACAGDEDFLIGIRDVGGLPADTSFLVLIN